MYLKVENKEEKKEKMGRKKGGKGGKSPVHGLNISYIYTLCLGNLCQTLDHVFFFFLLFLMENLNF